MTKKDFLNALVAALSRAMTIQEMTEIRDYCAEQIDDRIEEGMSEAEAVAALGDPEALAARLIEENSGVRPVPRQTGADTVSISERITRVSLDMIASDVTVSVQPLPEGQTARLKLPGKIRWSLTDGLLRIEELETEGGLFLRRIKPQELTLASVELEALQAQLRGGDLTLRGVAAGTIEAESASGDIDVETVTVAGMLSLQSRSGDVSLCRSRANAVVLKALSGDVRAETLTVDEALRIETRSGDVDLRKLAGQSVDVCATSGDIAVSDTALDGELAVETSSGDIDLHGVRAGSLALSTRSGDIDGELLEAEGSYRFEARTVSGDLDIPSTEGARPVRVESTSGDIRLRVEV